MGHPSGRRPEKDTIRIAVRAAGHAPWASTWGHAAGCEKPYSGSPALGQALKRKPVVMLDEDASSKPQRQFSPAALAEWSEADLRHYIAQLQAEIARAEQAIAARASQRQAAEAFFRRGA